MKKIGLLDSDKKKHNVKKWMIVLCCAVAAIVLLLLVIHFVSPASKKDAPTTSTTATTTKPTTTGTTVPVEPEPTILPKLAEMYADNPDLIGWLTIEGTVLDYPVMYTPEDEEKYLYKNIKGKFDANGLPFIDDGCSMDPESDNIIIYGHNMKSGKMFASLLKYAKKSYWEKHPIIRFSTLYEEREYEIVAAFYDRVYYKYETCFKFYQFINAKDEAHYKEAISQFKKKAKYETGVTAEYGDKLITLVTCSDHEKNGRFVVVAREVTKAP